MLEISGSADVDSVSVDSNRNLVVTFRTTIKFHGRLVVDKEKGKSQLYICATGIFVRELLETIPMILSTYELSLKILPIPNQHST